MQLISYYKSRKRRQTDKRVKSFRKVVRIEIDFERSHKNWVYTKIRLSDASINVKTIFSSDETKVFS